MVTKNPAGRVGAKFIWNPEEMPRGLAVLRLLLQNGH